MRPSALPFALAAALATACATPCEELGNKLCECAPAGSARSSCEDSVTKQLKDASPDDALCKAALDHCHEPSGTRFCDWIHTAEAKVACGLAYGEPPP